MPFIGDSLTNLVSGLGTDKDKLTHSRFHHNWLGKPELDALYTSDWLAGSIVDAPCDDMTREWRGWKAGARHVKSIEAEEKRLRVRQRVNLGLKQARQYGGSVILMGMADKKPGEPLDVSSVSAGDLKFLHVLSRYEIATGALDRDPMSETYGEPTYYEVFSAAGQAVRVHPTRVVRFLGQAPLELSYSVNGWGLSILQRVYDAVRHVAVASGNLASLTNEAKVDVISIPNLTQNARDPIWRGQMIGRFALANQGKSTVNALLLDAQEKWEQKTLSFAELPTVVRLFLEIAAGAANMPVTRLLGTSPKGLNATGESDIRHYYDTLSSRQEVELRPALERLDEVLVRSAGANPARASYEFHPLWQLTDAERAAVGLQRAQATQIYARLGVMDPEALRVAVRSQLLEDKIYPGLDDALVKHPGPGAPLIASGPQDGSGRVKEDVVPGEE